MNIELIKKGEQIIKELGNDPGMLKKWMAHYIAELMEQAKSENKKEAESTSDLCAQLIIKLWDLKIKEQVSVIKHQFWDWRNSKNSFAKESYDTIKKALENPEELINIGQEKEVNLLQSLGTIEEWLVEIYSHSVISNKPESNILNETMEAISVLDDYYRDILKNVSKFFPVFSNLSIKDLEKTENLVKAALHSINKARSKLLEQS